MGGGKDHDCLWPVDVQPCERDGGTLVCMYISTVTLKVQVQNVQSPINYYGVSGWSDVHKHYTTQNLFHFLCVLFIYYFFIYCYTYKSTMIVLMLNVL